MVTARNGNAAAATALSLELATRAWGMKERFKKGMMGLSDAVQLAASVGRDRRRKPIILADVADNPGGGARGNTTYLLRALKMAGAKGVILGVFNDAALAAQRRTGWARARSSTPPSTARSITSSRCPSIARPRS